MINPYQNLITYEGDSFRDYMNKIHVFSIFKYLFEKYEEEDAIKITKYILYAYSKNSDELNELETFEKTSNRIFQMVGLSEDFVLPVLELECEAMLVCIEGWLAYQNNEYFTQWVTYRQLRKQFLSLSLKDMKKNTGEIDIEAKMKAATYASELLDKMTEVKQSFVENNVKLQKNVAAFNQGKQKVHMGNRPSAVDLVRNSKDED